MTEVWQYFVAFTSLLSLTLILFLDCLVFLMLFVFPFRALVRFSEKRARKMTGFERVLRALVGVLVLACVVPTLAPALLDRPTWLPRAADVVRAHPSYASVAAALPRALRPLLGLALDLCARAPAHALLLCALHAAAETLGALLCPALLRTALLARLRTRAVALAALSALTALARTVAPTASVPAALAHSFAGAYLVGARPPVLPPRLAPGPTVGGIAAPDLRAVARLGVPAAAFLAESLLFPHSPATRGLLGEVLAPLADVAVRASVWLGEAVADAQVAPVGVPPEKVVSALVAHLAAVLPTAAVVLAAAVVATALVVTLLRRIFEALCPPCDVSGDKGAM